MTINAPALSFNDVLIIPRCGIVKSRNDVTLNTTIAGITYSTPIIPANMSSVSGVRMVNYMISIGGLGILHRMQSIEEFQLDVKNLKKGFGFSVGYNDWKKRCEIAIPNGGRVVCLDVAHAHSVSTQKFLKSFYKMYGPINLIIGNIATHNAISHLMRMIEDIDEEWFKTISFKIGIGGGSLCTTRLKTGCGLPTFQSIIDIFEYKSRFPIIAKHINLIADGGIKHSGDIMKAIGAGANSVMVGNLIAGAEETPGMIIAHKDQLCKVYRGSASFGDKKLRNESTTNIEGAETLVPCKGPVINIMSDLHAGIRSGVSYMGYSKLEDCIGSAEFRTITQNGWVESTPHGK